MILDEIKTLPELLLVDKPLGISSFDVIRIIQKHFGKEKIGHAGTLDPLATGLMLLGVNRGTKKLTSLTQLGKTYITDILLGKKTTTGDLEGEIIEEKQYPDLKEKEVENIVYSLRDVVELPVSLFSALKKDGKPLYYYAREGIKIETPIRPMSVLDVSMLDFYKQEPFEIVRVRFAVSKGTYIRSLGEELGRRLGVPATLASLRRVKIGDFRVEDSYTIPENWLQDFKNNKKDLLK